MFRTCMQKGFYITFANGLTASVHWGPGNYCDNRFPGDGHFSIDKYYESATAEVAIIGKDGELLDDIYEFLPENANTDGTVAGYLTPEQVVYFLQKVAEKA